MNDSSRSTTKPPRRNPDKSMMSSGINEYNTLKLTSTIYLYYFLITYRGGAERKYYNHKKKILSFWRKSMYPLYVLELKKSRENFRLSVYPSIRLSACLVRRHNNFLRDLQIQTKFCGCLPSIKCSSGIEFQSKIVILIRILILTKIFQNKTKFLNEYL